MTIIIDIIQKRSEKSQEKTSRNDHQFQQSIVIHNNFSKKTFLYTNNKHGEKELMEINSVKMIHNWLKYGECLYGLQPQMIHLKLNLNLHPRLM